MQKPSHSSALVTQALCTVFLLHLAPMTQAQSDFSIRLVNGSSANTGRVEMFYQGVWGTVCREKSVQTRNTNFLKVVCRQLGYADSPTSDIIIAFGAGSGPVLLTNLDCEGGEANLAACRHDAINPPENTCNGQDDKIAGVSCFGTLGTPPTMPPGEFDVRLQDGATSSEGRVEISYQGSWGSVCHNTWTKADADVVCRQLGYPSAIYAWKYGYFGEGTGLQRVLDGVVCTGSEPNLAACKHNKWGSKGYFCENFGRDAGVTCNDTSQPQPTSPPTDLQDFDVRLVDGHSPNEGRVEVYYKGEWGKVCREYDPKTHNFNDNAANVVCKQLGYQSMFEHNGNYGSGSGPLIFSRLDCDGQEPNLAACGHRIIGFASACSDQKDTIAGVACDGVPGPPPQPPTVPDFSLRLADGATASEGRVEISYKGTWGKVCHDGWNKAAADVVCRQLGFPSAIYAWRNSYFGEGTRLQRVLDGVKCTGSEPNLAACGHYTWGSTDNFCENVGRDAGVTCNDTSQPQPTSPTTNILDFTIRLADGPAPNEGRVEVYYQGEWGTVCREWGPNTMYFNDAAANVACKQLGFQSMFSRTVDYGSGSGPLILSGLLCDEQESNLVACGHDTIGLWSACSAISDKIAGLACDGVPGPLPQPPVVPDFSVRLANGSDASEGRVEISYNDVWGTVCSGEWDMDNAKVVCRQLGYQSAIAALTNGEFGAGSGPIYLRLVHCDGPEPHLAACGHSRWASNNCEHANDAGVICNKTRLPTTSPPTTPEPTTNLLTTPEPATNLPTTPEPTTSPPTTPEPTTNLPTTPEPATNLPTTPEPTTSPPTTPEPTTNLPTTPEPTTNLPTTPEPTTSPPTTPEPTTNPPTTPEPTTSLPTTQEPTTNLPITPEPTTNLPITPEPTTSLPATPEPTTRLPTTRPHTIRTTAQPTQTTAVKTNVPTLGTKAKSTETRTSPVLPTARPPSLLPDWTIRLTGYKDQSKGIVQVYWNGDWGEICDDNWTLLDSNVVCRQLGYTKASSAYQENRGQLLLNPECGEKEQNLKDCKNGGWTANGNCDKVAALECDKGGTDPQPQEGLPGGAIAAIVLVVIVVVGVLAFIGVLFVRRRRVAREDDMGVPLTVTKKNKQKQSEEDAEGYSESSFRA